MELNNKAASDLIAIGNWNEEKVEVPVIRNKFTGQVRFPATDGSNIIADKYICLTTMYGTPVCRTRDNVNNNILNVIVEEAKKILIKDGKEELAKFIIRKNIPNDWRDLIYSILNII